MPNFKSLDYESHLVPKAQIQRSSSQCEHAAVPRSKSQLNQTMPMANHKMSYKGGVAVPFLDLTKVVPNFSLKQQEKQLNQYKKI